MQLWVLTTLLNFFSLYHTKFGLKIISVKERVITNPADIKTGLSIDFSAYVPTGFYSQLLQEAS